MDAVDPQRMVARAQAWGPSIHELRREVEEVIDALNSQVSGLPSERVYPATGRDPVPTTARWISLLGVLAKDLRSAELAWTALTTRDDAPRRPSTAARGTGPVRRRRPPPRGRRDAGST